MDDRQRAELAHEHDDADRLCDLADMYANQGDYKRAALTYCKALGHLLAAVDAALAAGQDAA